MGKLRSMQQDDDPPGGRKRQRSFMATDSEWARIGERASAADMSASAFICHRAAGPATAPQGASLPDGIAEQLDRIEFALATLTEVERLRLTEWGEKDGWEAVLRMAGERRRAAPAPGGHATGDGRG